MHFISYAIFPNDSFSNVSKTWEIPNSCSLLFGTYLTHWSVGCKAGMGIMHVAGVMFNNLINTQEHPDVLRSLSQCAAGCTSPVYWHIWSNTTCSAGFLAAVLNKYLKAKIDLISMTLLKSTFGAGLNKMVTTTDFHFSERKHSCLLKHEMVTLSVPKSCP